MRKRGVIVLFMAFILLISINSFAVEDKSVDSKVIITTKQIKENLPYIHEDISLPIITISQYKDSQESINKKISGDVDSWRQELLDSAKQYKQDYEGMQEELIPFELVTKYRVTLNKNNILSIPMDYYQYTAGAHGLTIRTGYNFVVDTGKALSLSDLFKEKYDYITIINNEVKKQIAQKPEDYFDNGAVFKTIKSNQDFYLTDSDLIIYFPLYEIAPYVGGIREFKIPYVQIKDGLKITLQS